MGQIRWRQEALHGPHQAAGGCGGCPFGVGARFISSRMAQSQGGQAVSILDQIAFDQIADERDKAQQENKLLKQRIKRLEESLTSIAEYWNRDNNE